MPDMYILRHIHAWSNTPVGVIQKSVISPEMSWSMSERYSFFKPKQIVSSEGTSRSVNHKIPA